MKTARKLWSIKSGIRTIEDTAALIASALSEARASALEDLADRVSERAARCSKQSTELTLNDSLKLGERMAGAAIELWSLEREIRALARPAPEKGAGR